MEDSRHTIGFIGIGVGAIALLIAIVHLWAGPFSPQPSLEKTVAEKAVAIKNATIAALKGEKIEEKVQPNEIDIDRGLRLAIGVLGGLAVIWASSASPRENRCASQAVRRFLEAQRLHFSLLY